MGHHNLIVKTEEGIEHIVDQRVRTEVFHMLEKWLDYVIVDGKKYSVHTDYRSDGDRITIIEVEDAHD